MSDSSRPDKVRVDRTGRLGKVPDPTPEELAGLSEDEQDYLVASNRDHDHEEFIPLEEFFAKRGIDINRLREERRRRRAVATPP